MYINKTEKKYLNDTHFPQHVACRRSDPKTFFIKQHHVQTLLVKQTCCRKTYEYFIKFQRIVVIYKCLYETVSFYYLE